MIVSMFGGQRSPSIGQQGHGAKRHQLRRATTRIGGTHRNNLAGAQRGQHRATSLTGQNLSLVEISQQR
jgi:hypothetical protein